VHVLEVRTLEGYGARWTSDGSFFRGFLEPHMEDGHEKGWAPQFAVQCKGPAGVTCRTQVGATNRRSPLVSVREGSNGRARVVVTQYICVC
jgi:hypothetical protein